MIKGSQPLVAMGGYDELEDIERLLALIETGG